MIQFLAGVLVGAFCTAFALFMGAAMDHCAHHDEDWP